MRNINSKADNICILGNNRFQKLNSLFLIQLKCNFIPGRGTFMTAHNKGSVDAILWKWTRWTCLTPSLVEDDFRFITRSAVEVLSDFLKLVHSKNQIGRMLGILCESRCLIWNSMEWRWVIPEVPHCLSTNR